MSSSPPERPASFAPLALFLLVSGACALIFQVVWMRELRLVFGATTTASAAVLAIFMIGLGTGNACFGKFIDRSAHPLRWYGTLETIIACFVALTPYLTDFVRQLYFSLGGQTELGITVAIVVRLAGASLVMAVPTFCMGGTMPAVARAYCSDADPQRRSFSLLYGINTLGAVSGALLANFVLLEALGNRWTLWSGCCLNAVLAATALLYARGLTRTQNSHPTDARLRSKTSSQKSTTDINLRPAFRLVAVTAFVVGFVFFLLEIVWYRMTAPLLGGTTYTFGLILAVALAGIGVGGAAYHQIARWIQPSVAILALTCLTEAICIAIPFWLGDQIALWVLERELNFTVPFLQQVQFWSWITAIVVLPASIVAGFQFPLLIAIAGSGRENVGRHVGWTFAANTTGAITGSLLGGFLLLPKVTAPGLWQLSALILIGWGSLLLVFVVLRERIGKAFYTTIGLIFLAIFFALSEGPTAVWRHAGIGAGRAELVDNTPNGIQDFVNARRRQLIWEAEGRESSVGITATDSLAFLINGKSDGNTFADAGTQIGLALVGHLLHPAPEYGLVIGLGTGESAGWLADVEGMQQVDVVELEPQVREIAARSHPVNRNVLDLPHVHIIENDAREYLSTTNRQYDVIVSEPSNPYRAGVANLFTEEFYLSAAQRLRDGGLFLQWLQAYEIDDQTVGIVLNTMRSVFPAVEIWQTKSRDLVIVCRKTPIDGSQWWLTINRRLELPRLREALLRAWHADDLEGTLSHLVCTTAAIDELCKQHNFVINTDDRNQLEYAFAKNLGRQQRFAVDDLQHQLWSEGKILGEAPTELDWQQVARRNIAGNFRLGGTLPDETSAAMDVNRVTAAIFHLYAKRQFDGVVQIANGQNWKPECPIERLVFAHALAETGQAIEPQLLQAIENNSLADSLAVAAIAEAQQTINRSDSVLRQAITALYEDPWGDTNVLDALLRRNLALCEQDKTFAAWFFAATKEPFIIHRLEERRILIRYLVAEQLSNQAVIEALAPMEPNVPWKEWLLERRRDAYRATNHSLQKTAELDLNRFRNQ